MFTHVGKPENKFFLHSQDCQFTLVYLTQQSRRLIADIIFNFWTVITVYFNVAEPGAQGAVIKFAIYTVPIRIRRIQQNDADPTGSGSTTLV